MSGWNVAPEEVQPVARRGDQALVEEREAHLVTGAVDDEVDLLLAAVGEPHALAAQLLDRGLGDHRPRREPVVDLVGERRVRLPDPVVGPWQADPGGVARADPPELEQQLLRPLRQPRRARDLVDREPVEPLADDPHAAAQREVGRLRHVARVARHVHPAVAAADDEHPPPLELLGPAVVVPVHHLAGELARVGRVGPALVPVVPVADHDGVVAAHDPAALHPVAHDGRLPGPVAEPLDALHLRVERDQVAQREVVDVRVEVLADLPVHRVVLVGHREVRERHPRAGRVHLEGRVAGAHPVRVVQHPVAADLGPHLEPVKRDAGLVQRLRRRDPRRAGADHQGARERRIGLDRLGAGRGRLAADHVGHRNGCSRFGLSSEAPDARRNTTVVQPPAAARDGATTGSARRGGPGSARPGRRGAARSPGRCRARGCA